MASAGSQCGLLLGLNRFTLIIPVGDVFVGDGVSVSIDKMIASPCGVALDCPVLEMNVPHVASSHGSLFFQNISHEVSFRVIEHTTDRWEAEPGSAMSVLADLCALARPHLNNPFFTRQAAGHYGVRKVGDKAMDWPAQLASGEYQLYREAEKANEKALELAIKARPERRHYERAE